MDKKIAIALLVLAIAVGFGLWLNRPQPLGGASGQVHSNVETFLEDVTFGDNVSVAGMTNTSGSILTAGTVQTGFRCATSSIDVASLAVNATSTYGFAITGATTTAGTNFVYSVFNQTSSAQGQFLDVAVKASSTQGAVTLLMTSKGGTYIGQSVFNVCQTKTTN